MTEQDQRIALCEWLGWKIEPHSEGRRLINPNGVIVNNHYAEEWRLPDTNSLDVLHEMEMKLDVNALSAYADYLDTICVPVHICPLTHWQAVVMATAAQRREALLKTLGLWKD